MVTKDARSVCELRPTTRSRLTLREVTHLANYESLEVCLNASLSSYAHRTIRDPDTVANLTHYMFRAQARNSNAILPRSKVKSIAIIQSGNIPFGTNNVAYVERGSIP